MTKKNIALITLFIIFIVLTTINITFQALVGQPIIRQPAKPKPKTVLDSAQKILRLSHCRSEPMIKDLKQSNDPHLIQLDKYQQVCRSLVTNQLMIFTDMPKDDIIAKNSAQKMAQRLKLFAQFQIRPLVIVEPVTAWGLIDFREFRSGFYDHFINTYFKTLKQSGIKDKEMGTWVPFPEANLPLWNHINATPADYAAIVNKYLRLMKKYFPQAKGSVLLNSATYENDDFSWTSGEYVSLRPYLINIDHQLVDSFGVQGFPWAPPKTAQDQSRVFNPQEFLSEPIITEAAEILGVKKIWFNTGTFGAKYTVDPENKIEIDPAVRLDILNGILSQAVRLKKKGYQVTINLFAQDKSNTKEATDWSYLSESLSGSKKTELIFKEFIAKAIQEKIGISLFDRQD